jgi:hypothetical protein
MRAGEVSRAKMENAPDIPFINSNLRTNGTNGMVESTAVEGIPYTENIAMTVFQTHTKRLILAKVRLNNQIYVPQRVLSSDPKKTRTNARQVPAGTAVLGAQQAPLQVASSEISMLYMSHLAGG